MIQIKKVTNKVYAMLFDSLVELRMHFGRYYESYDNPRDINIIEVFGRNLREKGKMLPETMDTVGFNLDSETILSFKEQIKDENRYDRVMIGTTEMMASYENGKRFDVIGISKEHRPKEIFRHEYAHSLWARNRSYKREVKALLEQIPEHASQEIHTSLLAMGYGKQDYNDEIQAFICADASAFPSANGITRIREKIRNLYDTKYKVEYPFSW